MKLQWEERGRRRSYRGRRRAGDEVTVGGEGQEAKLQRDKRHEMKLQCQERGGS